MLFVTNIVEGIWKNWLAGKSQSVSVGDTVRSIAL